MTVEKEQEPVIMKDMEMEAELSVNPRDRFPIYKNKLKVRLQKRKGKE